MTERQRAAYLKKKRALVAHNAKLRDGIEKMRATIARNNEDARSITEWLNADAALNKNKPKIARPAKRGAKQASKDKKGSR